MTRIAEINQPLLTMNPVKLVALTAWGEARGDGARGMQGVINVIMNRASHPRWWGSDVPTVCLANQQFSCWNADDPNRAKMLEVTAFNNLYKTAYTLADAACAGRLPDLTMKADHYHSLYIKAPAWAQGKLPTVFINNHVFYRLEI